MKSIEERLRHEAHLARSPQRLEAIERIQAALSDGGPAQRPPRPTGRLRLATRLVLAAAAGLALFFLTQRREPSVNVDAPTEALALEEATREAPIEGWSWSRSPLAPGLSLLAEAGPLRDPLLEEFGRLRDDTLESARSVFAVLPSGTRAR